MCVKQFINHFSHLTLNNSYYLILQMRKQVQGKEMLQILQLLREVGILTRTLMFLPFCSHILLRDHVSLERPRQGQLTRKEPRGQDLWLCWGVWLRSKPSWSHRPDKEGRVWDFVHMIRI